MAGPSPPSSRSRDLVWALLLVAATLLVYQPAWNGQPLWDDNMHMTPPELRSLDGLARIWAHSRETMQYFPLVHTVFWVQANLWGDSPLGYHLLNILLHVATALLLVKLLRKLGTPGPWLAAAIFALHPVMVESVAWISELKNTLSGLFFVATALTYFTYTETRSWRPYAASLVLFTLGLLSKSTIAPLPLALLAALWWKRGRLLWKPDVLPLLPFGLAALGFALITLGVERTHLATPDPDFALSPIARCLLAGRALWFYLGKVFLPVNLTFSYPRWNLDTAVGWHYLFPAAALLAGGLLWALRQASRAPAAGYFYFAAMLLPYLGLFSFYTFRYSFVADHYQYLAALGPIVVGVGALEFAFGSASKVRMGAKTAVGLALLLTLGLLSRRQSAMYADAETLYRATITRNDSSWMAHNELGIVLAKARRTDEALAHYQRALALGPHRAEVHNNLGLLLADLERADEALGHYQKVLQLDPKHATAHNNLGILLARMGRTDEALAHYRQALELQPSHAEADYNLGLLLSGLGRTDEASLHYQRALERNPHHVGAHNNLGVLLAGRGRTEEALTHYRVALQTDPGRGDVRFNLAGLLADLGRTDEALAHYRKVLELEPERADAHYHLGLVLTKTGRGAEAAMHYQKALELEPDHADAHNNLGILLAGRGRIDEALAHFRRALEADPAAIGFLKNLAVALAQKGQLADGAAVLEAALAAAKAAGDETRERKIAQVLAQFHETMSSAQAGSGTKARR